MNARLRPAEAPRPLPHPLDLESTAGLFAVAYWRPLLVVVSLRSWRGR